MDRRTIFGILSAALVAAPAAVAAADEAKTKHHRLVIHVDQNDPALMNMALNNAGHVVEYYHERGEEVAIEIVAYSQGLHMLRDDTSPVKDKIRELRGKLKTLSLAACNNTMRRMQETEGKPVRLIAEATVVPSGVVRLMELQEQGWSYVRP
jgi:intracellular sulfur oxidation DsrE/DsrF family protein